MLPSIRQLQHDLATHRNTELAQQYGYHHSTIKRWRAALGMPPFPCSHKGDGPIQRQLLALLQPAGTWHRSPELRQQTSGSVHESLLALYRQGRIQRRGTYRHYEYALREEGTP